MSEHYTRNTESMTKFCPTCGRLTQHAVHDARVGRCLEHQAPEFSKAQLKRREQRQEAEKNPRLFV